MKQLLDNDPSFFHLTFLLVGMAVRRRKLEERKERVVDSILSKGDNGGWADEGSEGGRRRRRRKRRKIEIRTVDRQGRRSTDGTGEIRRGAGVLPGVPR